MEKRKLTEICNPKQWKTIPTSELVEVGYPVYGANGIIGFYNEYNHEEKTIAITCRGATCGTVNLTCPKAYITGNAMCLDNVNNTVILEYLFYAMKAYDFSKVISGSAQPQITRQGIEKVEVVVYPKEKQQQIVCELQKVESLITARQEQLLLLDQLVKSRFIELFGDIAHSNNKICLEEISDFVTVGIANSATHAYADSGVVMLRNQNIKENYLDENDLIYITPDFAQKYGSKQLAENDILVIRTGYPGVACLVPKKYEGCQTFTTLIVRLKDSTLAHANYVCHYINSSFGKDYVEQSKVGVAQQNFGAKALAKMPIAVPPVELQKQFATFVEQTDKSKLAVQQGLQELEILKKSLMQQYFG